MKGRQTIFLALLIGVSFSIGLADDGNLEGLPSQFQQLIPRGAIAAIAATW